MHSYLQKESNLYILIDTQHHYLVRQRQQDVIVVLWLTGREKENSLDFLKNERFAVKRILKDKE